MSSRTHPWRLFWALLPLVAVAACAFLALRAEREALLRETRQQAQTLCERAAGAFVRELAALDSKPLPRVDDQGRLIDEGFLYPEAPVPQPITEAQAWFASGAYERVLTEAPDALSPAGLPLAPLCAWRLLQAETDPQKLRRRWHDLADLAVRRHPSVLTRGLLRQAEDWLQKQGLALEEMQRRQTWDQWEEDTLLRDQLRRHVDELRAPRTGVFGLRNPGPDNRPGYIFHADDLGESRPASHTGWRVVSGRAVIQVCTRLIQQGEAGLPPFASMNMDLHTMTVGGRPVVASWPFAFAGHRLVRATVDLSENRAFHLAVLRHMQWTGLALALAFLACAFGAWQTLRALRRQEQLAEQKSNFISGVSHELRAPLASLRLMSESLVDGTVTNPARTREYHEVMHEESVRLSALVDNVLDLARIERGVKTYDFAPCDPAALIAESVRLLTPRAERQKALFRIEAAPFPQPPLADLEAVRQALLNLLDNALKHTPEAASITISARPLDKDFWCLSVADQGPGVPPAERQRVFDLFYRIGSELRRETTGTGLGLSLVKHIAEGHGGRASITEAPGGGALVTLKLRLHPSPSFPAA